MSIKQGFSRFLLLLTALVVFIGCVDQDPFGLRRKALIKSYSLERAEDGTYQIVTPDHEDGGGVLEGTVEELAWSSELILARRHSTFRGDPDGWMVIDVATGAVRGPLSKEELQADPKLSKMTPESPANVWKR